MKEVIRLPNIKSAEKRVKIAERNATRNRSGKTAMKTVLKKFFAASDSQDLFVEATSSVDKAASKGIIHKNKANRAKAQLAKAKAAQ